MSWDYRIVKRKTDTSHHYSIHEVYYDDDGKVYATTTNPIVSCVIDPEVEEGDPREVLISTVEMILSDIKDKPIFDVPEEWY